MLDLSEELERISNMSVFEVAAGFEGFSIRFDYTSEEYRAHNRSRVRPQRLASLRRFYAENRDSKLAQARDYYAKNAERIKQESRQRYAKNAEAIKLKQAEYRAKNAEAIKLKQAEYRAKRRAAK